MIHEHVPAMTLSMAYSKSRSVTKAPLNLAACKVASFTILAISAPEGVHVDREREISNSNLNHKNLSSEGLGGVGTTLQNFAQVKISC